MNKQNAGEKIRISFDLDEVLFVSPATHKIEKPPIFPLNKIYKERVRLGTPALINELQELGFEVWIYTSSFRTESYIRHLFMLYDVHFDGIVNAQRHLREVQRNNTTILPQKMPSRYRISLHVDDDKLVCSNGMQYGYKTYYLDAEDELWKEKILIQASRLRSKQNK